MFLNFVNSISHSEIGDIAGQVGGQSNAFGASNKTDPDLEYQKTFGNVNYEGAPLNYRTNYDGDKWGFDLAFAKEFNSSQPNSTLYLEKEAVGGTSLEYWLEPTNLNRLKASYAALRARVSGIPNIKVVLVWHNGESDSNNSVDANLWNSRFTMIVSELETAHGAFDNIVVCILGDIPHPAVGFEHITRQQQIDYVASNPKAIGWDMTPYSFYDDVHYDNPSKYQMGLDLIQIFKRISNATN